MSRIIVPEISGYAAKNVPVRYVFLAAEWSMKYHIFFLVHAIFENIWYQGGLHVISICPGCFEKANF